MQRADGQDDVQEDERGRSQRPDQQGLDGGVGKQGRPKADESAQVAKHQQPGRSVIDLFLTVPSDRAKCMSHRQPPGR